MTLLTPPLLVSVLRQTPYAGHTFPFSPAQATSSLLKCFLKFILIKLPAETLTKIEHYKQTPLRGVHRLTGETSL